MKNIFLSLSRLQKQMLAATADLIALPLIFYAAALLHTNSTSLAITAAQTAMAVAAGVVALPVFLKLGLYRAVVRFIDQRIISTVCQAVTVATLALAAISVLAYGQVISLKIFFIFWLCAVLYVVASRFLARGFLNQRGKTNKLPVAIYGAGQAGSLLANAIWPGNEYLPVVFIDDDPQRANTIIGGIKVYPSSELERLSKKYMISTVLLAMPELSRKEQRVVLDRLALQSLRIKVTPPISSLIKGRARVEDVRQIEIEDLLSRDVVAPNTQLLSICITGKVVMVSGAGGSIGSELCRQIVSLSPAKLILFDVSEFALYSIEQELREWLTVNEVEADLFAFVGSVLDTEKCTRIFKTMAVDTVYHAAAYKHVPLVEHNPIEGIRNNAFGTLSIANAALAAQVGCFVLISTDKAVRPTNVMGATKRLAELVLQAFAQTSTTTRFSMVRFGNVLGSSGSVVPLFRKQIAAGGPLTLTHPDITRYFMTIPEAAQLVIQAGAMGMGGDVFVLDMGEPVRIADLAVRMIHLSGQEVKTAATPTGTIQINYVGLRPGEKLYEELLIGDNVSETAHPLIKRAREARFEWPVLKQMLQDLDDACKRFDHNGVRLHLQKIVKEFAPSSDIADNLWCQSEPSKTQQQHKLQLQSVHSKAANYEH